MAQAASFPHYTAAELALDRALHAVALPLAMGGVAWLLVVTAQTGGARHIVGLAIYGAGLIGMFAASAAYNSCSLCRMKELLRQIDFCVDSGDLHAVRADRLSREHWPADLHIGLVYCRRRSRAEAGLSAPVRTTAACTVPRHGVGDIQHEQSLCR
jgi:hypothetical protein